ncbi:MULTISPECIES: hypothetical protein [Stenotrophomonas maltophilia group]|uniref:hypothetical protein n=1 Tax=Stenotrophomonas maltophilia group TaxID=995085 RepID=UPI0015DDC122|nr:MULTISPECIES: hypothetical protein [Stenotrophomonas maltophilia group]MBA0398560.1 hypothetical protein [Stenotrophomonas maltophilia]
MTQPAPHSPLWTVISGILAEVNTHKWAFGFLGTLVMVVFFWRIRYLPSLTLTDIGLVAFAIVVFSTLMIAVVLTTGLLPAMVLVEWEAAGVITDGATTRPLGPGWVAPAFGSRCAYLLGTGTALYLLWRGLYTAQNDPYQLWILGMLLAGVLGSLLVIGTRPAAATTATVTTSRKFFWYARLFVLSTGLYLFAYALIAVVMFGTHSAAASMKGESIFAVAVGIPCVHLFILSMRKLPFRTRAVITGVLVVFLLGLAGTIFEALDRAAKVFQLGLLPGQSVVVTAEGCRMAKASGVVSTCRELEGPGKPLREIENVLLLNRLGSQVVIAEPGWTVLSPKRTVPLPSSEVFTWYAAHERSARPSPPPQAEKAVVPPSPPPAEKKARPARKRKPASRPLTC